MRTSYLVIVLAAILIVFWMPVMAGDARLLLNTSPDLLGDNGLPMGWQMLRFQNVAKATDYSVEADGGGTALKAVSQASASGIYTEVDLDATEFPLITWDWKVANLIEKGDATTKDGDDFPARIIVAFHYDPAEASAFKRVKYEIVRLIYGRYPPGSALVYIWDNRLPVGTMLDNANASWAKMVILESGPSKLAQWVSERRNVSQDYAKAFDHNPPRLKFIGIMTDTDDTGGVATAYYRHLSLNRS